MTQTCTSWCTDDWTWITASSVLEVHSLTSSSSQGQSEQPIPSFAQLSLNVSQPLCTPGIKPLFDNCRGDYFFYFYLMRISLIPTCGLSPFHRVPLGRAFSAPSHQAIADSNEVSASPSFLWAEQTQLTQPLLVCPVLQPWSFWWPLLDWPELHWEPIRTSTEDGVSPVQKKGKDPLPCHAGCAPC